MTDIHPVLCFLEIGGERTSLWVSHQNDIKRLLLATPPGVGAALSGKLLLSEKQQLNLSSFLSLLERRAAFLTATSISLLTHSLVEPQFHAYVQRWIEGAVRSTTAVSLLPNVLFCARLAATPTVLVVHDNGICLASSPVIEGVFSAELVRYTSCPPPITEEELSDMLQRLDQRCSVAEPATSSPSSSSWKGELLAAGSPTAELHHFIESFCFLLEAQVAALHRREMSRCLDNVILWGGTVPWTPSQSLVAAVLSLFLPEAVVAWL